MSRGADSLDEKRVYCEAREPTVAYVACDLGVTRVAVSGDQVGRVGLSHPADARDVAGADGSLAVATAEDVLVRASDGLAPTGFGPAVAVGVAEECLAAGPDGRVGRLARDGWRDVGAVEGPRSFDGTYLAAGAGVYRVTDDGLHGLGLSGVRDVAAAGPYAATAEGLYRLGAAGTWECEREEPCSVVAATAERAHAVAGGTLRARRGGEWPACDLPAESRAVDVAYGEATYAVTADGTFLVDAGDGWRGRALGVGDVVGLAVP